MNKQVKLNNGLQVAYTDEGKGVPVLLMHGYCGSRRYWDEVLPLLSAHVRVIAPDARGHGDTEATEGTYFMETLAEDAVQLLDALELQQAYVLGHSMGGYAVLALAERSENRLKGFGLLHSTSFPDDEKGKAGRDKAAERIAGEGMDGHIADLVPKLFAPDHRETLTEQVEFARKIGLGTSPLGAIGGALGMKARPDRRHVLEQTDLPVILLAGEEDAIIPPEKRFPVEKPGIQPFLLSGAGHMGMLEAPQAFAQAVLSYVKTAEQGEENSDV